MNKRFLIALLCAIFFGLLSIGIANRVMQQQVINNSAKSQTSVVFALTDIQPGTLITDAMVGVRQELVANKPDGSFGEKKPVVGQRARFFIPAKTTVTSQQLTAQKQIIDYLCDGCRAVSVPVNESSSVAGFVSPGSSVDVIAVMQAPGGVTVAKTILQNIRVIATGDRLQNSSENKPGENNRQQFFNTVTLEVKLDEAETLALASRQGSLQLTIRDQEDKNTALSKGRTSEEILERYSRPAPAIATASPRPQPAPKSVPLLPLTVAPTTIAPTPVPPAVVEVNVIKGKQRDKYTFAEQAAASSPKGTQ